MKSSQPADLNLLQQLEPAASGGFQVQTKAAGPAGSLPLTDDMLRNWSSGDLFGMVTSYLQYDLSDTTSGDFWYRAVIAPEFTKGISALVGYSSVGDETETMYGIGYQYGGASLRSELSADGDMQIRISYSF